MSLSFFIDFNFSGFPFYILIIHVVCKIYIFILYSIYMHLWFNIMLCLLNLGFADTYVYTTRKQIQYLPNLGYH